VGRLGLALLPWLAQSSISLLRDPIQYQTTIIKQWKYPSQWPVDQTQISTSSGAKQIWVPSLCMGVIYSIVNLNLGRT